MDATETARRLSDTQAPLLMLRQLYGAEEGVLLRPGELLPAGDTPIGREVEPGLSLRSDRRASRHHATLRVSGRPGESRIHLIDQHSKNGSFVNGERVNERELFDGDLIRIGDSLLLVRHEPVAAAVDRPIAGVIGSSPAMRMLRREIQQFAPTQSMVLLLGETGTGKEVAAQALHRLSPRAQQPFVVLDCGAVPRTLIESELFGHEAGAFTSAQKSRVGLFEQAHGGTLFIDELGELPLALQPMLLRALEQGVVRRVGSTATIRVDVRVIAATNRDLQAMIAAQQFRADLYARLAELQLSLTPLGKRREDILELLVHVLTSATPSPPSPLRLSPDLAEALLLHPWPYNVRELIKVAGELRVRGSGAELLTLPMIEHRLRRAEPIPTAQTNVEPDASSDSDAGSRRKGSALTREGLERIIAESNGVISEVARRLGCSRKQVYRYLEAHDLDPAKFR